MPERTTLDWSQLELLFEKPRVIPRELMLYGAPNALIGYKMLVDKFNAIESLDFWDCQDITTDALDILCSGKVISLFDTQNSAVSSHSYRIAESEADRIHRVTQRGCTIQSLKTSQQELGTDLLVPHSLGGDERHSVSQSSNYYI